MESQLPAPRPSGETGVYSPQTLPPSPEALPAQPNVGASPERAAPQEQQPAASVQAVPVLPIPSQPVAQQGPVIPVLNPLGATSDVPAVAGDDEVIEKEWVDKAKKIVSQTKDDPYQQEKEVSKLQADYLKKRYGKDVKLSGD